MPEPTDLIPEPGPEIDASVSNLWDDHKSKVFLAVGIFIALLVVYGIAKYSSHKKAAAATAALANATTVDQLRKVSQDYSGTPAGANALLMIGEKLRGEKKYDDAIAVLKDCTNKYPNYSLIAGVWMSMAATYEAAGKNSEAMETYQLVATKYPKAYCAPSALLSQGALEMAAGKNEEARRVFEAIMTQYPDSFARFEAQRRLQSLPK